MPELGTVFDRYVIEAVLGEGGMGRVYRALDPRLGRRVALKVLLTGPERFGHEEAAARMMREARAAATFNHPNVVAIYDVGEHEGSPFLAMELVTGQTLRALIPRELPVAQKITWLLEVARGLGAAHRAGLVHRDVKPDNVMITTDGVAKILDFGIAREAQGAVDGLAPTVTPNLASLTAAGVSIGTPQYMPPEQLRGERLDGRADQYAWAVTAYELLSGAHPWATASGAHLVAAVLSMSATPLRVRNPAIEPRVSDVVARAMEKSPGARFATMDELVHALDSGSPSAVVSARAIEAGSNDVLATANTTKAPATAGSATSPPSTSSHALPRRAVAVVAGLALLAIVVAIGARATGRRAAGDGGLPSPSASIDAALPALRLGLAPATPAASAAYATALQREHDAKLSGEISTLGTVIDLDPTFAAAYVRRAALFFLVVEYREAREPFHRAWDLRAGLGEVDASILEAMEPAVREPPVVSEYLARIQRVSDRYPREILPAIMAASACTDAEQLSRATTFYDRAIAADPTAALPYFGKGELAIHAGNLDEGGRLFDECTQASPTNVECLSGRMLVLADTGRCEEVKGVARRILANAELPGFDESLAAAAVATGEPLAVVGEYLARASEQTDPSFQRSESAKHETQLAWLGGDFRKASALAKKWDDALKEEHRESGEAMLVRFAIAEETGELPALRAEILATWNRSVAWLEASDPTRLRLSYREYQAGLIGKDELEQRRQAWRKAKLEDAERKAAPVSDESLWRESYVIDATSPEEAGAALAHYAEAGVPKLSLEMSAPRDQLAFGVAYARAGNYAAALPFLREGTRMCRDLGDRFAQTQALFYLGQASEQAGDVAGARRAYDEILAAWGAAKPRSITAAKARAHLEALGR